MLVDAQRRFLERAAKQYSGPESVSRFINFSEAQLRIVKLLAAKAKIKRVST